MVGSSRFTKIRTQKFTSPASASRKVRRRAASASRSEKTTLLESRATESRMPRNSTSSNRQAVAILLRAIV